MSAQVRCHYLTDGTVNFAFTVRRSEYFIPAGILLKCFLETTDKELFRKLVGSAAQVRTAIPPPPPWRPASAGKHAAPCSNAATLPMVSVSTACASLWS